MIARKTKSIEQYCSVCKETFDMPVAEERDDVVWLQCPGCKGYLPFMTGEKPGEGDGSGDAGGQDLAPEDFDPESAREYSESEEYEVGEIVYHRSWNDYGKIVAKEQLSGERKTIEVQFVNQGRIRLLEGVGR
ncbi:MAG: hypothetical protein JW876_03415 [Candidatus Krumholzibacteriota bacterium]|nr:hypothetical protein [Candidatus Krumholzibacteriota bacterium]